MVLCTWVNFLRNSSTHTLSHSNHTTHIYKRTLPSPKLKIRNLSTEMLSLLLGTLEVVTVLFWTIRYSPYSLRSLFPAGARNQRGLSRPRQQKSPTFLRTEIFSQQVISEYVHVSSPVASSCQERKESSVRITQTWTFFAQVFCSW